MKKKGFTLVELLAVIAILAILVIIALPNVMKMFRDAKENAFKTELKNIYKVAQQTWMSESMFDTNIKEYARCKSNTCPNTLDLSGRTEVEYYIKLDKSGKVVAFDATDGTYQYHYSGPELQIENINNVEDISTLGTDRIISISCSGSNSNNSNYKYCFSGVELKLGDTLPNSVQLYDSYQEIINNSGYYFFTRLKLENNIIESADFMYIMGGNEYYIPIRYNDSYETRKNYIISAFGESNCEDNGSEFYCTNNSQQARVDIDWIKMYAYVSDMDIIQLGDSYSDGARCNLWYNNKFSCG